MDISILTWINTLALLAAALVTIYEVRTLGRELGEIMRDVQTTAREAQAASARTAEEVRIVAEIQRAMLMELRRAPAAPQ